MAIGIAVQVKAVGIEGIKKSHLNKITRTSLVSVGARWHGRYLERHFTPRGARIYGYGARSGEPGSGRQEKNSYTAWKKKKKGHSDPLVKSGRGKKEALANKKFKARISSKLGKAVLTIQLPKIFNFNLRRAGKSKTNANEEIRKTTMSELRDLDSHFVKTFVKEFDKAGRRVSATAISSRG